MPSAAFAVSTILALVGVTIASPFIPEEPFNRVLSPLSRPAEGPGDLRFHVESEKDFYLPGEVVRVRSWFTNPRAEPVVIDTFPDSCTNDVVVLNLRGEMVYDGRQSACLMVFIGDLMAQPGESPWSRWEWDQHYRVWACNTCSLDERQWNLVPAGSYLIRFTITGTSHRSGGPTYTAWDSFTII